MTTLTEKAVYLLFIVIAACIGSNIYRKRLRQILQGRKAPDGCGPVSRGWYRVMRYLPGQWYGLSNLKNGDLAGIQHLLIVWGGALFIAGYFLVTFVGDIGGMNRAIHQWVLFRIFLFLADPAAVLVVVGLTWGLARRTVLKPSRLGPDFEVVMFLMVSLGGYGFALSYFALEGLRLNLGVAGWVGPVSGIAAGMIQNMALSPDGLKSLYTAAWYIQAAIAAGFMVYIPFSDHQHPVFAPFTIYQGPHLLAGTLHPVDLDKTYKGIAGAGDMNQRQLTELYACTQCGRCQDACPAAASGTPLSPKQVVVSLKNAMDRQGGIRAPWKTHEKKGTDAGSMGESVVDDALWSCTTCMACVEVCPAFVSPLDKIVDLRRDRVLIKTRMFKELGNLFKDAETFGDTFGKGRAFREDWAMGKGIRVLPPGEKASTLFWVGCQGTFHDRAKSVSTAFAELLTRFDPDFAILGKAEQCCGDPLRRLGNEYLFRQLAEENIAQLSKRSFERIVTCCPHCYNMLKNEYPRFGGRFNVMHYTELMAQWANQGQLEVKNPASGTLAYHDPCYLARGNGIVDAPRKVLAAVSSAPAAEVRKSGADTFCCGGGGGRMWMRETGTEKINEQRVRQLTEQGADIIATSCPYCLIMLEDGAKSLGLETLKCRDIAEIVRDGM